MHYQRRYHHVDDTSDSGTDRSPPRLQLYQGYDQAVGDRAPHRDSGDLPTPPPPPPLRYHDGFNPDEARPTQNQNEHQEDNQDAEGDVSLVLGAEAATVQVLNESQLPLNPPSTSTPTKTPPTSSKRLSKPVVKYQAGGGSSKKKKKKK